MTQKTCFRMLKCVFTEHEMTAFRDQIADEIVELGSLEDEKKAVVSGFSAKINEKKASTNNLASKIKNGYEYREIRCLVSYDYHNGIKTIAREDTGEIVAEERISEDECQRILPIEDEQNPGSDEQNLPSDEQFPPDEDDFLKKMNEAPTADEGRNIIKEFESRIITLMNACGLAPVIGQINDKLKRGFSTLKKKEISSMVRDASKVNPGTGLKLSNIVNQWPAMRERFDQLVREEHERIISDLKPEQIIDGDEDPPPDPGEIDENPEY